MNNGTMSQKECKYNNFLIVAFTVTVILFSVCVPNTGKWESQLLYKKDEIKHNKLTTGNSVLLFPLIREKTFDTTAELSPEVVLKPIIKQQTEIELLFKKDFEKAFSANNSRESLDSFYVKLFENDILGIMTSDSAWKYMPGQFLLIIRMRKGVRINSFDGIMKRKAVLESEIWDRKKGEVIWRAQTSGFEMNKKTGDAQFIAEGIKEIFKLLPEFIPFKEMENW